MTRSRIIGISFLAAISLALVPELLPTGPSASLDAAGLLDGGQLWVATGVVFLGGLLTSLTPCVYPLIPITVGVFGARQADSRGRAFLLTTAYVVGMGAVFAALGVAAAMSGKAFGSALGSSWVVLFLAGFLFILSLSMFGAYELAVPSGLAMKLNSVGGGGVIGAFLMGSVSGFLAAPCTGPVLSGVLAWVSRTQSPVLGAGLLFIYAMGIGVPFFLIGVFTVRLPRGGVWMDWVKSVFGVALVALAAGYLRDGFAPFREGVASAGAVLGRFGGIGLASGLAFAGVMLGALHLSFKAKGEWLPKGLGVTALVVAFLVRGAASGQLPIAPVDGQGTAPEFTWSLKYDPEKALPDGGLPGTVPFDSALAQAKAECRPVMIDFFADWCASCKELDQHTYVAREIIDESKRFVNVKVDGTGDNDALTSLYERYGIQGLPTVIFIDPMGKVLDSPRVTGFLPPEKFLAEMHKVSPLTACARTP